MKWCVIMFYMILTEKTGVGYRKWIEERVLWNQSLNVLQAEVVWWGQKTVELKGKLLQSYRASLTGGGPGTADELGGTNKI